MKPLLAKDIKTFLDRFENFEDCEIKDIQIISPVKVIITFALQDKAREFNWINLDIEFNDIEDAKLLDASILHLIDLNEGITIAHIDNAFVFCVGKCYNISQIKNSICYLICKNLKYCEKVF